MSAGQVYPIDSEVGKLFFRIEKETQKKLSQKSFDCRTDTPKIDNILIENKVRGVDGWDGSVYTLYPGSDSVIGFFKRVSNTSTEEALEILKRCYGLPTEETITGKLIYEMENKKTLILEIGP